MSPNATGAMRSCWVGLLMVGWALPARAEESATRVVVRSSSRIEEVLAERLRGQVSDLPVLLVRRGGDPGADLQRRADAAAADLAAGSASTGATPAASLWFAEVPDRLLVFLSRPGQPPTLLVRLRRDSAEGLSSAELEVGAVVMRSALRALTLDQPLSALQPAPDELPASDGLADATGTGASVPAAVVPFAALALQQWVDDSGLRGRQGAALQLGIFLDAFRVAAIGALSFPVTHADMQGRVRIARHDIAAAVAMPLDDGATLFVGVHLGAAFYHRATEARTARLTTSVSRLTPALLLGPGIDYRWDLAGPGGRFGLLAQAAVDVMPAPPRFVYNGETQGDSTVYAPGRISGRVGVGLVGRWP